MASNGPNGRNMNQRNEWNEWVHAWTDGDAGSVSRGGQGWKFREPRAQATATEEQDGGLALVKGFRLGLRGLVATLQPFVQSVPSTGLLLQGFRSFGAARSFKYLLQQSFARHTARNL